jgi:hypothetical protein
MSCDAADLKHPPPDAQEASEVVPLTPGKDSVTIDTSASA